MRITVNASVLMALSGRASSASFIAAQSFVRSAGTATAAHLTPTHASRKLSSTSTALSMSRGGDSATPFTTWTFDKPCEEMSWSPVHPAQMSVGSSAAEADLVLVGVYAAEDEENGKVELSASVDESVAELLRGVLEEDEKYKAGAGETTGVTRVVADGKATKYALVGLGKASEIEKSGVGSKVGSGLAKACIDTKGIQTCAIVLPTASINLSELSCAFYSDTYADNRFRTGDKVSVPAEKLTSVAIVVDGGDEIVNASIEEGKKLACGIHLCKDIVNSPHNVLNSHSLADSAKKLAAESNGLIKTTILNKNDCEKRGMGAYLGVARGSETEPKFIHMTYKPKNGKVK